jgi:hypothetical protein
MVSEKIENLLIKNTCDGKIFNSMLIIKEIKSYCKNNLKFVSVIGFKYRYEQ